MFSCVVCRCQFKKSCKITILIKINLNAISCQLCVAKIQMKLLTSFARAPFGLSFWVKCETEALLHVESLSTFSQQMYLYLQLRCFYVKCIEKVFSNLRKLVRTQCSDSQGKSFPSPFMLLYVVFTEMILKVRQLSVYNILTFPTDSLSHQSGSVIIFQPVLLLIICQFMKSLRLSKT